MDLEVGETKTVSGLTMTVPEAGRQFTATINPEGSPGEIREEIKPRSDNSVQALLDRSGTDLEVTGLQVQKPCGLWQHPDN